LRYGAVRRLATDCFGKPKPEIVGIGPAPASIGIIAVVTPRQKICLIGHGR